MRAASLAGLCLVALCARAETAQYSVSFKIVAGKLAVDRDMFHVAPGMVKFEPAIRLSVRRAIAEIGAISPDLLIDSTWPAYTERYAKWAAADPARMDLGTLFSSDFLFSCLVQQTPDNGLILNEDDIDPEDGAISFSILPLFDASAVHIESERVSQLRKRLKRLNGELWSSAKIRKAIAPLYANLGLTPEIVLFPARGAMQIIEGPRIASILLPADQVPAKDVNRLLWLLLNTAHYRKASRKRSVDFDDGPYAVAYQIQELQLLISPLGYTLVTAPSTRAGPNQYVDLVVQAKKQSRHVGAGFEYKPGQGASALGNLLWPPLSLSAGGPSGVLGSGAYSVQLVGFSASASAGVSLERNRLLDGVKVNEQTVTDTITLGWEPWRGLSGNTLLFQVTPAHAVILNQTLNTIEPALRFVHSNLASEYPLRFAVSPHILIGDGFSKSIVTATTHRSFDHWEYDFSGRFENAFGDTPIFELPSFGGDTTVRGFRADDAIGRRLWADQNEIWFPLPRLAPVKIATFGDLGGAYQTIGSEPGLRAGVGTGLRLDLRVAVLKFDWAYGFGQAATGGSRGKFYFNVFFPTY